MISLAHIKAPITLIFPSLFKKKNLAGEGRPSQAEGVEDVDRGWSVKSYIYYMNRRIFVNNSSTKNFSETIFLTY
jgi:hypothetical protein